MSYRVTEVYFTAGTIVWVNKAACKLLKTTFKLLLQQSNSKKYFLIYKYWYRVVNHKLPHRYIYTTKFCIYTYSSHQLSNHLSKPPVWGFADHFPWSQCRRFWPLWKVKRWITKKENKKNKNCLIKLTSGQDHSVIWNKNKAEFMIIKYISNIVNNS